jgi:putative oxidoreductase
MSHYGPLVLRLALSAVFIAHGARKLFGVFGGPGLAGTAALFESQGLAAPLPLAILAGVVELCGGALLIPGVWTRLAAALLIADVGVGLWKVQLTYGFFLNWTLEPGVGHGIEFSLILVAALTCLILTGPGALSVDGRRARSAEAQAAGRARIRATGG